VQYFAFTYTLRMKSRGRRSSAAPSRKGMGGPKRAATRDRKGPVGGPCGSCGATRLVGVSAKWRWGSGIHAHKRSCGIRSCEDKLGNSRKRQTGVAPTGHDVAFAALEIDGPASRLAGDDDDDLEIAVSGLADFGSPSLRALVPAMDDGPARGSSPPSCGSLKSLFREYLGSPSAGGPAATLSSWLNSSSA